jgi:hypothetical protein
MRMTSPFFSSVVDIARAGQANILIDGKALVASRLKPEDGRNWLGPALNPMLSAGSEIGLGLAIKIKVGLGLGHLG